MARTQLDGLADLGGFFSAALNRPVASLWRMQNGYALCFRTGLDAIAAYLGALQPEQTDMLRGKLCIGYTAMSTSPMPKESIDH